MSLHKNHQLTVCPIHLSRPRARFSTDTTYLRTYSTQRSPSSQANRSQLVNKSPYFIKPGSLLSRVRVPPHLSPSWVTQIHLVIWPRLREVAAQKIWPVPEAVVTVLCTPDDGYGWHPKHVEWTCRIINRLLCVASRCKVINIRH